MMGIKQARHNGDMLYIVCDRHSLWAGDQDVYCFKNEVSQTIKKLKCEGWTFNADDKYEKVVCGSCHRSFATNIAYIKDRDQTTDYWINQSTKTIAKAKSKSEKKNKFLVLAKIKKLNNLL